MNGNKATGTVFVNGEMIAEDVEIQFELEAVPMTKFKTEKRKARVGERILITDAFLTGNYYSNGDTFEVERVQFETDTKHGGVYVKEHGRFIRDKEYEVIVDAPSHNENLVLTRLYDAEAQIDELQRKTSALEDKVKALEVVLADKSKFSGIKLRDYINPTPNQRRADVIRQARAFVAEHTKHNGNAAAGSGVLVGYYVTKPEFIVNSEKGTVVVLMRGVGGDHTVFARGIAKCAPDDVFNADIGKAIAAGRMYGVKVPEIYFNAPKPTEVVVGMRVGPRFDDGDWLAFKVAELRGNGRELCDYDGTWIGTSKAVIIDDTEAQYV